MGGPEKLLEMHCEERVEGDLEGLKCRRFVLALRAQVDRRKCDRHKKEQIGEWRVWGETQGPYIPR